MSYILLTFTIEEYNDGWNNAKVLEWEIKSVWD